MKKIAFIIQRYGPEINGGAEQHCRQLAEKLAEFYEATILTTCAFSTNWENHYPEGLSRHNNVTIQRFKVTRKRSWSEMRKLELIIKPGRLLPINKKIKRFIKRLFFYGRAKKKATLTDYNNWIAAQGPMTPDLIRFLTENEKNYDCLIFFTYLYYPTVFGIGINPAKTIFIPTAHDEWPIRLPIYKKMFHIPACIMYNTEAEKKLVSKIFNNEEVYSEIAGVGVDKPGNLSFPDIKKEMNIHSDYILYIGRINSNKISKDDFKWFIKYREESGKEIKLVLIGISDIKIPLSRHILHVGYVDDNTKFNLLQNCLFLFQPSKLESLSIVVLESFMMEKPVLVHRDCEVMKDHIDNSNGGYYYNDYNSFKNAVDHLVNDKLLNIKKGRAGKLYVEKNYSWKNIVTKYRHVIDERI